MRAPCLHRSVQGGIVNNYSGGAGSLAATGTGITVGGVFFQEAWLLAAAVGFIVLGAIAIRLGWRRDKSVGAR
jgi:hypothetical protein